METQNATPEPKTPRRRGWREDAIRLGMMAAVVVVASAWLVLGVAVGVRLAYSPIGQAPYAQHRSEGLPSMPSHEQGGPQVITREMYENLIESERRAEREPRPTPTPAHP